MFSVSKTILIFPVSSDLGRKKSKFFLQMKCLFSSILNYTIKWLHTKVLYWNLFFITKKCKLKFPSQYHCAFLLLVQSVTRSKVGIYTGCLNYMRWFLLWNSTTYKQLKTSLISKWTNTGWHYRSNWDKVGTGIK